MDEITNNTFEDGTEVVPTSAFDTLNADAVTTCSRVAYRDIQLCVPVSVTPFANAMDPIVRCCGDVIVRPNEPDTEPCRGRPGGTCDFQIIQRICVQVPVEFGAEAETGEVFVDCLTASTQSCGNCPEFPIDPIDPIDPDNPFDPIDPIDPDDPVIPPDDDLDE